MEEIDLNDAVYEVLDLPYYSSWTSYIYLKWICIYEKDHIKQFKQGFDKKKINIESKLFTLVIFYKNWKVEK